MGGDHHHHGPPKVPDYTIYKTDGIKVMKNVEERLAKHGLKDPWARNSVWRFHPRTGTATGRFLEFFFRGFLKVGLPAFLLTVVIKDFVLKKDDHGHGDGHH